MKKFLPILVLLLAFTGFLAIQVSMDQVKTSANQSTTIKDTHVRYEMIFKSLNFTTDNKAQISLSLLKKPIVILNFWASWCTPCLKELPALLELSKTYQDQIEVIGINTDEDDQIKMMKKIKDKYDLTFPLVADVGGKISDQFIVSSIPFTIIYLNGSVYKSHKGYFDFSDPGFLNEIKAVLKK
jgi:thiol-disulfide isomerase/thioredoxin